MSDRFRKFFIYFSPIPFSYWKLTPENSNLVVQPGKTGRYPVDLVMRLEEGHYSTFDEQGLPVRAGVDGAFYHNYTTLCSYALANWEKYLVTGSVENASKLLQVAEFILQNGKRAASGSLLLYDSGKERLSAMNQGESISVLTRAWEYSRNQGYLDAAMSCVLPFTRSMEEEGVTYPFRNNPQHIWYEEVTRKPVRHILNGMVYALWGLRDIDQVTGDNLTHRLFLQGVDSVEKALSFFDTGYWSLYWYPEKEGMKYIASMMYHNLHIVQLSVLYRQTGNQIFSDYAERFKSYAEHGVNRMRAGALLTYGKLKGINWA